MSGNQEMASGRGARIVRRHAAELALDVTGDVLCLGGRAPRRLGPATSSVRHLTDPAGLAALEPADTVLSVCELWRPAWGPDELADLACRLRPGGRLLFVEPVAVTGASGLAQWVVDRTSRARRRVRFDRPVLDDLRAAGLTPVRVERICPDPVGRVRSFVAGTAVHR